MKKTRVIAGIALLALFLAPASLLAQKEERAPQEERPSLQGGMISFGNLTLIPSVEVQGVYDDNIYKKNGTTYAGDPDKTNQNKKESDWISHVKPGFSMNYALPERGAVSLGYQGDFAFYNTNTSNNWKDNQGLLDVNYLAPGGLILGINDNYRHSENPFGNADQYGRGRVVKRWSNDLKTKLGYNLTSNLRSLVYYSNSKQQYLSVADYTQDYTENEYGAGVEMRLLPKTWGFVRYHYGKREYDTLAEGTSRSLTADHNWHKVSTGFTWDPDAKISGELNVGYQWLKYDNPYADTAQTKKREDRNDWVAATSLSYFATATTTLTLSLSRALRNTASNSNERFIDWGAGLSVQQQLLSKVTLNAGVNYSRNDYNLPTDNPRTDNNYLANVGLLYAIQKWMGVGVSYNFNRKTSNNEINEFTDNQYMVSLKIIY